MAAVDSTAFDVTIAVENAVIAHAWQTVTPSKLVRGPITPGFLDFPAIGIIAGDGQEELHSTLTYADVRESFNVTCAQLLTVESVEAVYEQHILWRDELRRLLRKAVDGHWGIPDVVWKSDLLGWDMSIVTPPPDIQAAPNVLTTTFEMEVGYREAIG